MDPKIKICGVTVEEDALRAAELGADYIGLNFYPWSPRCVSREAARRITKRLPASAAPVGVFVKPGPGEVAACSEEAELKAVQIHGDPPLRELEALRKRFPKGGTVALICAVRLGGPGDLEGLEPLTALCDFLLLDAREENLWGGTGRTFPWELALELKRRHSKPFFLAGGLTPENVAQAAKTVRPYAVDAASGVESAPGRKDHAKLKDFISRLRAAA